jgi:hypothetical protein
MIKYYYYILILFCISCTSHTKFNKEIVDCALINGQQANEGYIRCLNFVKGWLTKTDSITGLIPTNLSDKSDIWEPHNSAADNYPFMVLTTYLLDQDLYNSKMLEMLKTEKKLTSRIKSLPDVWSFSKQNFLQEYVDMDQIIFGASEYIKDGLMPINEYIGSSPWQDRMMEMIDDLSKHMVIIKSDENKNSITFAEEINGEILQILSRLYWMTGNPKYLEWAEKIGDYYLLGERDINHIEHLSLRNHGCEIIGGLSELYVTLHFVDPEKKEVYKKPYYKVLDRILEVGRNKDGMFYNAINMKTGEILDEKIVDNWGYDFDAYYSVWLVDSTESYREAVLKGFEKLNDKYKNYPWEGTSVDGYADAIESAINLFNREPVPELKSWIDSEIQVMFKMQQDDGIIEGWHADGNFARTSIMYSLWKTQGGRVYPWRSDIIIGAETDGGSTYFVITAENYWKGKLIFDFNRHKTILNLPIDYPRINQFPEWFIAETDKKYSITSSQKEISGIYMGKQLTEGIPVELNASEKLIVVINSKD